MIDPASQLTPPQAHDLIPPALDIYLHLGDLVSLGHWALVAIDKMGGPNIASEIGEWFAGDWQEVSRSADALTRLGAFCTTAAQGIGDGAGLVARTWDGQAADAATAYFTTLAKNLSDMKTHFDDIADQFEKTAFGVKELANAAGSLVESLADYAIIAGISLAAAFLTSFTGAGAVAGGAGAGYSIYKGAMTIRELLEIRAKVWNACEVVLGLTAGSLSALEGFSTQKLPGAYDNPLVGDRTRSN